MIKAIYSKTIQKNLQKLSSYLMLYIDYHKNFKAIEQAELAVSKITGGMPIFSIIRKP